MTDAAQRTPPANQSVPDQAPDGSDPGGGGNMAPQEPIITSVHTGQKNGPLIEKAARLWIRPDALVVDVTYGKGNFWTHYRPDALVAHDLALDSVDFRKLPEQDNSADVVIYDPPYVAPGGRRTTGIKQMHDRYGMADTPRTPALLLDYIAEGLAEVARILKPRGIAMVKTMDYVWSGRLVLGHHHTVSTCLALGLEQVDEFVHVSGVGPQPRGRRQVHSRRAHSFLCIFQKVG